MSERPFYSAIRSPRPKSSTGELVNFFRILQRHYKAFIEETPQVSLTSRSEFDRLFDTGPETLTDLERALRFLYLQKCAVNGMPLSRSFAVATNRPAKFAKFDREKLETTLKALHRRLSSVVIENLSYEEFMPHYDREETLFYLDPPYYGREKDYLKEGFERADFQRIAALLKALRFILSLNDCPQARETFRDFKIESVKTDYSVTAKFTGRPTVTELLISN